MQTKSTKLKMLDFKIIDSRIVMREVQEFQLILYDIHAEWMSQC